MLYEALVVSLISLSLCIVSAGDRLECGLRQQHLRQHHHYHGARHPLDHDPIIFDSASASALHDNFDEAPSLLGDSCIFHRRVSDIGDNYDDEADEHYLWRSPLERLSPLPSLSMESSFSSEGDLFSTPATIISPGPQHAHHVDITAHQRRQQQQQQLHQQQYRHQTTELLQRTRSTGTTIVALLANNSTVLVLAADTRSTDGTIVADKQCKKLHALSNNIWCAGAGTSADVEALVRRVKFTFWKSGMRLKLGAGGIGNFDSSSRRRNANYDVDTYGDEDNDIALPIASVPTMLHHIRTQLGRAHGELGANLLVGGYDYYSHRALLAAVHPHGSMDVVNYSALGSGGLAAMGVLESKYPKVQRGITVEEGIQLAVDAVRAGIENDLGSGSQIDVCVIRREGAFCQRALVREQELTWTTSVHDGRQHDNKRRVSSGERDDKELKLQNDAGANGFGNVPFAIRSKRIVCGGRPSDSGKKTRNGWSMLEYAYN